MKGLSGYSGGCEESGRGCGVSWGGGGGGGLGGGGGGGGGFDSQMKKVLASKPAASTALPVGILGQRVPAPASSLKDLNLNSLEVSPDKRGGGRIRKISAAFTVPR